MGKSVHPTLDIRLSDSRYLIAASLFSPKGDIPRKWLQGVELRKHPGGGIILEACDAMSFIAIWDKEAKTNCEFNDGYVKIKPLKGQKWTTPVHGKGDRKTIISTMNGKGKYEITGSGLYEVGIEDFATDDPLPNVKKMDKDLEVDDGIHGFIAMQSEHLMKLANVCRMFTHCQVRALSSNQFVAYPAENIWIYMMQMRPSAYCNNPNLPVDPEPDWLI